jgi:hypothetical protein
MLLRLPRNDATAWSDAALLEKIRAMLLKAQLRPDFAMALAIKR